MYCIYIHSFIFFSEDLSRKSRADLQLKLTSSTRSTYAGDAVYYNYFSGDMLTKAQISEVLQRLVYRKSASESTRKTYIPMWDAYQPEMILPAFFTFLGFNWIWVLHSAVLRNYKISCLLWSAC